MEIERYVNTDSSFELCLFWFEEENYIKLLRRCHILAFSNLLVSRWIRGEPGDKF